MAPATVDGRLVAEGRDAALFQHNLSLQVQLRGLWRYHIPDTAQLPQSSSLADGCAVNICGLRPCLCVAARPRLPVFSNNFRH